MNFIEEIQTNKGFAITTSRLNRKYWGCESLLKQMVSEKSLLRSEEGFGWIFFPNLNSEDINFDSELIKRFLLGGYNVYKWINFHNSSRNFCNICGSTKFLEKHHCIPKSLGGSNDSTNIVTLCRGHHRLLHTTGYYLDGSIKFGLELRRVG